MRAVWCDVQGETLASGTRGTPWRMEMNKSTGQVHTHTHTHTHTRSHTHTHTHTRARSHTHTHAHMVGQVLVGLLQLILVPVKNDVAGACYSLTFLFGYLCPCCCFANTNKKSCTASIIFMALWSLVCSLLCITITWTSCWCAVSLLACMIGLKRAQTSNFPFHATHVTGYKHLL